MPAFAQHGVAWCGGEHVVVWEASMVKDIIKIRLCR